MVEKKEKAKEIMWALENATDQGPAFENSEVMFMASRARYILGLKECLKEDVPCTLNRLRSLIIY